MPGLSSHALLTSTSHKVTSCKNAAKVRMPVGHQVLIAEDFLWVLENEPSPSDTMHYFDNDRNEQISSYVSNYYI